MDSNDLYVLVKYFIDNTVNQLIFAAINIHIFVFMGVFVAIYFR